jgi:serine/threonine protein kinase
LARTGSLMRFYCSRPDSELTLKQARDHEGLNAFVSGDGPLHSLSSSLSRSLASGSPDATPPTPSLLSSTTASGLLSRRRLRLISRMFMQMCDAVEACHRVGISHRDIKPENFICMDDRGVGERKVVVKITDWGLGTQEEECGDFDCGSKPYMAYECRNNVSPTYRPREADVWSLGIVLLNLLFHRCPWANPTLDDYDFRQFRYAPVEFLEDRFRGIGPEVARFLAYRVFAPDPADRVTAGELGNWATRLVRLMGEGHQKGSASDNTFPIVATAPRASPVPTAERAASRQKVDTDKSATYVPSPLSHNEDGSTLPNEPALFDEEAKDESVVDGNIKDDREEDQLAPSSTKSKRRKRGARKGKSNKEKDKDNDKDKSADERDVLNAALAEASQMLARELSHTARSPSPSPIVKKTSKPSLIDRMKGALKNGNPDLEAFIQRVKERDAMYGAAGAPEAVSAPAKLGGGHGGSRSTGSVWKGTVSATTDDSKGRHWASASDRRERLGARRKEAPSPFTASPLSSMSSNASNELSTSFSSTTSATSAWSSKRLSLHPSETAACWRPAAEPPVSPSTKAPAPKDTALEAISEQQNTSGGSIHLNRSSSRGSMGSTLTAGAAGKKKLARMLGFNRDSHRLD